MKTALLSLALSFSMHSHALNQPTWVEQIFSREFGTLELFFTGVSGRSEEEIVNGLIEQDLRKVFFKLEVLSKTYQGLDRPFFNRYRISFKRVEDRIGRFALYKDMQEAAVKNNEAEIARYFAEHLPQVRTELLNELAQQGYLRNSRARVAEIKSELASHFAKLGDIRERQFLIGQLGNDLKRLRGDMRDRVFDDADIEKGLHEQRRRIREILLQVMSLDGFVEYFDEPRLRPRIQNWFDQMLKKRPKLLKSKYLRLSGSMTPEPILLPRHLHAMLAEIVEQIGDLKDQAELEHHFAEAMAHLGFSEGRQAAVMSRIRTGAGAVNQRKLSAAYQNRITHTGLLDSYLKFLGSN